MHEKTPLHTPALRSETGPVWFSFADSEGSGTHFFTFVPYQRRFLIIRRFSRADPWGGRESPANRGIRRAIGRPRGGPGPTLPTGAQERPAPPICPKPAPIRRATGQPPGTGAADRRRRGQPGRPQTHDTLDRASR